MEKINIQNRKNQNIVVVIEKVTTPKGLVFIMHGLSGNKDQRHILTFAEAFKNKGFTTIRFDTTNTFGESDGKYEDATVTSYFEDLEDVVAWSKKQRWYTEPFYLVGHSLGGISVILYAAKYPIEVKGLAPISTLVSGKLSLETRDASYFEEWEKTGWREERSVSHPERIKRLKWSHMTDRLTYDVLLQTDKLHMPTLLIVGDNDESTPPKHQQILYDKLQTNKELHILKNAPHTFTEQTHLDEIRNILMKWIDKVETKNNSQHEFNKRQYEQHVQDYLESNKDNAIGGGTISERVALLKKYLPEGRCILEVGSGGGDDALALKNLGYNVIASDFVEGFIKKLKQKGLETIHFDAKHDTLPEGIDAIFANAVFVHFSPEEIKNFLKKAKQKLHNEKILFMTVIKGEGYERSARARSFERDFYYYTVSSLTELLNSEGFEVLFANDNDTKWLQIVAKVNGDVNK